MLTALDAGAEDVRESGDSFEVITAASDLPAVRKALKDAGVEVESAEVTQIPSNTIPVDASGAERVLKLIDALTSRTSPSLRRRRRSDGAARRLNFRVAGWSI